MHDCLILGSGRSGTSMLAGILHEAGYFMGDSLHKPRESNPKGFFEWYRINRINEEILARHDRCGPLGRILGRAGRTTVACPGTNQRWLALLPRNASVSDPGPGLAGEMAAATTRQPFCYKDPRFCYTLPAWRPFLPPETRFICIFRDPAATAASILKECRSQPYLRGLRITRSIALRVWVRMHEAVLGQHDLTPGGIMFLHYDQVLDGSALPALSDRLGAALRPGFADAALQRSQGGGRLPRCAARLYQRLCRLAGHTPEAGPT